MAETDTKCIQLEDELHGFYPGNQGSEAQFAYDTENQVVAVATRYADDEEDFGWNWGLGTTRINTIQMARLRNWLTARLKEAGYE